MYYYHVQINYCNKEMKEDFMDSLGCAMRSLAYNLKNPHTEIHSAFITYGFLTEHYCDGVEEEVFIEMRNIVSINREDMLIVKQYNDIF